MPSAMVEGHRGIHCFRREWRFLQILNQSYQKPSNYPRVFLREMKTYVSTNVHNSFAHNSRKGETSNTRAAGGRINECGCPLMECYSALNTNTRVTQTAAWVNLEHTLLSERSQTWEVTRVWLYLYKTPRISKSIQTETRLLVARKERDRK